MNSIDLPQSIRIISYNCWGLKYLAKFRHERLTQIGKDLAKTHPTPEIVGLQECWTQQDYEAIRNLTRDILPYGKFYYSGIFGGGLAVLSKWPIEESSMYRYPLNGRPTAFFRGDWFVGKGVACARIRIGSGQKDIVEVFCTHLHAPYEKEPNDSYICHRTAQAWDIAKLMRGAAERGHLVIGLGDFNMVPMSLAHRIIEAHAPVKDVWRVIYPNSSEGAAEDKLPRDALPPSSAQFNLKQNGTTCDSALNTWRWNKAEQKRLNHGENIHVAEEVDDPRAKRLDYIFVGSASSDSSCDSWIVQKVSVGMIERHPELHCSLSDHFSIETTIMHTLGEKHELGKFSQHSLRGKSQLSQQIYDEILAMCDKYKQREHSQRRWRLAHFGLSIIVSIGCLVAVWWSPRNFVSFILMLLSTLVLSTGVIDGLIGGLFVGSELRALKEFKWEIQNAKDLSSRRSVC